MPHRLSLWLAFIALLPAASPVAHAATWAPQGAGTGHDVRLEQNNGTLSITTTGNDPYLVGKLHDLGGEDQVLEFEYFSTERVSLSVFLGPPFHAAHEIALPPMSIAEGWQTYAEDLVKNANRPISKGTRLMRLDFGNRPNLQFQIRNLRLRPQSALDRKREEQREQINANKRESAEQIASYLNASFPLSLHAVDVTSDRIVIDANLPSQDFDSATTAIVEFPAWTQPGDAGIAVESRASQTDGRLRFVVDRFDAGRDRVTSGWRITAGDQFVSPRFFPTSIATSGTDHAKSRVIPKTQKGLNGLSTRGPVQDFADLGVNAVTLNLLLNRFLAFQDGPNREKIDAPGEPVYFDLRGFQTYDPLIKFAKENDIVISATVLIRSPHRTDQPAPLAHPDNDGGVYAMPDLSTPRGTAVYSHILDRIAQRYGNPQSARGGISNWIVHNEIDFHTVWTNMGRQPREIVTETYYRSMRLIHNIALKYHPFARVFVSLTHHWTVPDDGTWKQLAPREVIETLQQYSRVEGDFAWGVAYHPYPESLFAKVAWDDKRISDSFDTDLITMQNLQVLIRFMQQPSMQDPSGSSRPILLSEQGFHTDSYEPEAQLRQAGSLHYAMQKVKQYPVIESFHYHRWIDHPDEGGLLLGLRTLPTKENRYGERKKSWFVYQAIGTDREAEATAGLPGPEPETKD